MKKFFKILASLSMCLATTGCFANMYTRSASNNVAEICKNCSAPTNVSELANNIEAAMAKVNAINGTYVLTNTKKTFNVSFDVLMKDKKVNWDIHASINYDDKDITAYMKNGKVYLSYPHNGANVIIKDSLENYVTEAEDTLDKLKATYDKENINTTLTGNRLDGFNIDGIKESGTYVKNSDNTYTITYMKGDVEWKYVIDANNYLIKKVNCSASNFNSELNISYPNSISITYPMGLDFLTYNVKDVKKVLNIDSFSELIEESK